MKSRVDQEKVFKSHIDNCRMHRLIKYNTRPDEIVEIYNGLSIWEDPFDFGLPKERGPLA